MDGLVFDMRTEGEIRFRNAPLQAQNILPCLPEQLVYFHEQCSSYPISIL